MDDYGVGDGRRPERRELTLVLRLWQDDDGVTTRGRLVVVPAGTDAAAEGVDEVLRMVREAVLAWARRPGAGPSCGQ